ncbi:MAG: DUF3825 domain-containing protein [Lachnospiraceae bacterium]|nr:DUF3825 domain-containing protein [Lachnospiraceae bacterium]
MFYNDVFKGNKSQFNDKLKILANLAEEEKWTFAKIEATEPYRILQNYVAFTYNRIEEEGKFLVNGNNMCFNTGLLTQYHQEIIALFSKYTGAFDYKWYLIGFFKSSDSKFTSIFKDIPLIADYAQDARELVYDRRLKIVVQKDHIIDDNFARFQNAGYSNRALINALLDDAIRTMEMKLIRNYKLALPFYYHNTETGEKKIQLLAPLYMAGAPVKLAIVLDRRKTGIDEHYEAITIIPVDLAYMNSRVIVRPEEEWAKIVDEVDVVEIEDSEKND